MLKKFILCSLLCGNVSALALSPCEEIVGDWHGFFTTPHCTFDLSLKGSIQGSKIYFEFISSNGHSRAAQFVCKNEKRTICGTCENGSIAIDHFRGVIEGEHLILKGADRTIDVVKYRRIMS